MSSDLLQGQLIIHLLFIIFVDKFYNSSALVYFIIFSSA